MPEGRTAVLGVTGGIAAYKAADIASRLVKAGVRVYAVMTDHAKAFLSPLTLETLTNNPVACDLFERPATWEVEHIALAKRADVFLIAPATANILSKLACGIADDMLSTVLMAARSPIIVAPAMNTAMWESAAMRDNLTTLRRRGVEVIEPESGRLACGDEGAGRLANVETITERVLARLNTSGDLSGIRVLITAGPTREPIDPVRYISNRSSGRMGYALSRAAVRRGGSVTLLTGPVCLAPPAGVATESFNTTDELLSLMTALAPKNDIVIQAAAPGDYRARAVAGQKIKKRGDDPLVLDLLPNHDVAASVGAARFPGQTIVAFAAETENIVLNARNKLAKKNADLVVANDVSIPGSGFDADTNAAVLLTCDSEETLPLMAKDELAEKIIDRIIALRRNSAS